MLAAAVSEARWIVRRRRGTVVTLNLAWTAVGAAGVALALAAVTFAALMISTPEIGAAEHMRSGLRVVLALLSAAAVLCGALPLATVLGWRRGTESVAGRAALCLLSLASLVATVLLWHYRLVGFHL